MNDCKVFHTASRIFSADVEHLATDWFGAAILTVTPQ
jgi:hypothetical protein